MANSRRWTRDLKLSLEDSEVLFFSLRVLQTYFSSLFLFHRYPQLHGPCGLGQVGQETKAWRLTHLSG